MEEHNEADSETIPWNEFYHDGDCVDLTSSGITETGAAISPEGCLQLLCHLLLAMAAVYMVRAYKDVTGGIKRERLSFGEAYKRLLTFLLVEKTFDIVCLDQILCMSTDYYQRCYPETKGCEGWKDRSWNNKNQAVRLVLYPIFCAVQAYLLTKREK